MTGLTGCVIGRLEEPAATAPQESSLQEDQLSEEMERDAVFLSGNYKDPTGEKNVSSLLEDWFIEEFKERQLICQGDSWSQQEIRICSAFRRIHL